MPVLHKALWPHPQRRRAPWCAAAPVLVLVLVLALLAGCASNPLENNLAQVRPLLHDELFPSAGNEPIAAGQVFALNAAMQRFADTEIAAVRGHKDGRRALMDALVARGQLRLDYDDGVTRTAAQAFEARAGNCLSLVIMTAAFAKYLDMPVRYQSVQVREQYSRSNELTLASGHINVVLSRGASSYLRDQPFASEMTVDFVPPESLRGTNVRVLSENTVLAMFMNNRAVETLTGGRPAAAYAWARETLRQDPAYLPGINTLAVVYLRNGRLLQAEAALRHVLARAPDDDAALTNLIVTLTRAGRSAEAEAVSRHLADVQPYPPFYFLDLGREALVAGDAKRARDLIARELRRQPYQHESHFWAAVADATLGDQRSAEKHMRQAIEHSGTPAEQARYSAKLAALRALPLP